MTLVLLCITGAVLISVAPQHTSERKTQPSLMGYVWVLVSMLALAVGEVMGKAEMDPRVAPRGPLPTSPSTEPRFQLLVSEEEEAAEPAGGVGMAEAPPRAGSAASIEAALPSANVLRLEKSLLAMGMVGLYTMTLLWVQLLVCDVAGWEVSGGALVPAGSHA